MPTMKRWRLNNFSAGIDRTDGRVTDQQNRFFELTNYRINNVKKIVRRPPNRNPGPITNCQGLIAHRGTLFTVAKRGDTPVFPPIPGQSIEVVYFDVPPGAGSSWQLWELMTFNGNLIALILHGGSGAFPDGRFFLHIFDEKVNTPTYVEDSAVPTNWTPELPNQFVGFAPVGSVANYRPRMTVANGRVWISRPDGNVGFSGISKGRVWNQLTVDDLIENGQSWHFFIPDTGGPIFDFLTSASFTDIDSFYGSILEYLDSTGAWIAMSQVSDPPTIDKTWSITSVTPPWSTTPRVNIRLYWTGAAGTQIRFRSVLFGTTPIIVVAPSPVLSVDNWGTFTVGTGGSWSGNGSGTIEAFNNPPGGGQPLPFSKQLLDYFTSSTAQTLTFYYGHGDSQVGAHNYPPSMAQVFQGTYVDPTLPTGTLGKKIKILRKAVVTASVFETASFGIFAAGDTTIDLDQAVTIGDYLLIANASGDYHRYRAGSTGTIGVILHDVADAAGNFTAQLSINRKVYNFKTGASVSDYVYPATTGDGSDFLLSQQTTFQLETAGFEDAGFLPTAAQPAAGGTIVTALSSIKDRLLVCYRSGSELWFIPPDVNLHQLVDTGAVGTGQQELPWPQLIAGVVMMGMARGMRGNGLFGLELQSLRDQNLGEPIFELGYPQQNDSAYWAQIGAYVTAVTIEGVVQFLVLELSPEEKIRAWERWTVADLPEVEENSISILDRRLYFRAGGEVWYFDEADTFFRDDTDPAAGSGDAFESFAKWHFNDLKEPYKIKHVCGMEASHIGQGYMEVFQDARNPDQGNGEVLMTDTLNSRAVPAVAFGQAIAISMRSVDDTGHEIEEIGLHYRVLGRG